MSEMIYPALKGLPGYSGHLNEQVVTLPEILRQNGYHTYMAGKWHLGEEEGQTPEDRGFEESFALIQGGGSQYARQKPIIPFDRDGLHGESGKKWQKLPADFYSTSNYPDTLIAYIEKHGTINLSLCMLPTLPPMIRCMHPKNTSKNTGENSTWDGIRCVTSGSTT